MYFMKHLTLKHRHQTPSSKQPQNQIVNSPTPNSMSMMIKPVQEINKSSLDDLDTSISPAVIQKLRRYSQNNSSEERIEWLQSQVIGNQIEFDTPFGKRTLTYADHTASGRSLKFIEDYIVDKVLPSYGNTHTDDSFVGERTTKLAHKASEFIKKCMGGGDDDSIIFCGSGTTAAIKRLQEVIGIAVSPIMRDRVLESAKKEERWVVFIGPYEHHSNILSWRQSLAEVVEIGLNPDGLIDLVELERELKSPKYLDRPKLGSFSACSNVTGIATDTRAVARLLHRHGAFAAFDFAASGPYVEINMRSGEIDGYDAVYLSPHKFIGGPGTPGILLMSNAMYRLGSLPPSTCGGGTVAYVNGFNEEDTLYYDKIEEREDAGTPQIIQKIRAALAFWVKEYIGYELIDLHESFYIETALRRLLPNPNIKVLGNTKTKRLSILSFLVYPSTTTRTHSSIDDLDYKSQPLNGRFVAKLLNDLFGIQARGGCACAGPYGHSLLNVDEKLSLGIRSVIQKGYNGMKPGWTRISFPYYMAKEEFAFIMAAVEFIGMYGHRFLPLYTFHWESGDWSFDKRSFKYHLMEAELANASRALFSGAVGGAGGTRDLNALIGIENSLVSVKEVKAEVKAVGKTHQFAAYLEAAKRLAQSLPADPPRNSVPDDIVVTLKLYE
ncbi:putative cysteine desulfurase [Dioscorea sansibarensis]